MKYSFYSASMAISLLANACGGSTEGGQGSGGSGARAGSGGMSVTGGRNDSGGRSSSGGATATGGQAGTGGATQCQTATDCAQPGAPCQACPDGTWACPIVDCVMGQCIGSFPTCATMTCTADEQCPKSLAPCQTCADGTLACPWARCENGSCKSGIDSCTGSAPCAGKACGASCAVCDSKENCSSVLMYCDAQLKCQLNQPMCPSEGCTSDAECPGVGLCPPCPDGNSCAELKCVAGACKFQCDAGGGTSCSAEQGSCAMGETCCDGLLCCAGVPVPQGQEYCGKVCPKSDQNMKRNFTSVNPDQVLEQLSRLPIGTWSYRTESTSERHIGPMAQDFMATFGVGSSDLTILQVDADGVAFAAIQALNARLETLEAQNQKLQRALAEQGAACGR